MRSFRNWRARVGLASTLIVLTSAVAACGGSDSGGDSATVKVLLQPTAMSTTAYIAQEKGFFDKVGLDVELEMVANQAAQVPLLVSDQADLAVGGIASTAIVLGQGLPFKIFATSSRNETDSEQATNAIVVSGDSDIKDAAGLEGKKVAMGGLKGLSEYMVRVGVEAAGGDPSKVQLIQLDQASGVAALEKGEVDAALVYQPFVAQALADGKKVVSYPSFESAPGEAFTSWYANTKYLDGNADTVKKFVEAIEMANDYANKNPDEANAIIAKELSMEDGVAEILPATVYGGEVDAKAIQTALDNVERYGWNEKELPAAADVIWDGP